MPQSTLEKIESRFHTDRERKAEVLRVCSTEHPQPTWEQVSDALNLMWSGKYHSGLERVQSQFPTGEYLSVTSHTSHHNLPLPLLIAIVHVTCHAYHARLDPGGVKELANHPVTMLQPLTYYTCTCTLYKCACIYTCTCIYMYIHVYVFVAPLYQRVGRLSM